MKISDIDENFKVENGITEPDMRFLDVADGKLPFDIYGLYDAENGAPFRRLPDAVAKEVNEGVTYLALDTAGGRVRFSTDSPCIAIKCIMPAVQWMSHMTQCGSAGFDLYVHEKGRDAYVGTFMTAGYSMFGTKGYEQIIHLPPRLANGDVNSYTIHFPLYNHVDRLWIGLKSFARLEHGAPYISKYPVVYYGSSITQGGCASRPGNAYQNLLSEELNVDHINLGFSGSARGEAAIAEYIASLDMSAFVLDYDHNSPSSEHLLSTHLNFCRTVRNKHPNLPLILMSRPNFHRENKDDVVRRDIVYVSFITLCKEGDENIYFLDGEHLFDGAFRDACTVDTCHPNDAGFVRMAQALLPYLYKALKL